MKLTKYEHACLILDNDESRLIIDPGCFTNLLDDLGGVSILVITEEHTDHFDIDNVRKVIEKNPQVKIFTTMVVAAQLSAAGIASSVIEGEQTVKENGYKLGFYETPHAPVYKKSPCRSLSVRVDDYLFYPSDSYNIIDDEVEILALPTSGPWHKLEEAIDFANSINSKKILATHNALYSDDGQAVANNFIKVNIVDKSRDYIYLKPGESL